LASDSEDDARDVELATLSGENYVDLLRTSYQKADFKVVVRILKARDRSFTEVNDALSDIDALWKKYDGPGHVSQAAGQGRDDCALHGITSRDLS
jgi:hypothetical protein